MLKEIENENYHDEPIPAGQKKINSLKRAPHRNHPIRKSQQGMDK